MSMAYGALRSAVLRRSAALGVTPGSAAMQTMTRGVMVMADDVPTKLQEQLVAAERRWLAPVGPLPALAAGRVAAWQFLDPKNGDGMKIEDRIDMLCVPPMAVEAGIASPGSASVRVTANADGDVVTVSPR